MTNNNPTIAVGQAIPDVTIHIKSDGGIDAIKTADYFHNCRVIMIALPGAFTGTCSAKHLLINFSIVLLASSKVYPCRSIDLVEKTLLFFSL